MLKALRIPASRLSWLWALLPLLLAAALPSLCWTWTPSMAMSLSPSSPRAFCVLALVPCRGLGHIAPRHPPGWSVLLSIWGLFVGWSEFAIRALSLFIGLLTLAWVYRAGRDFFAPAAG